jgi:hypothetical protein
MSSQPAVCDIRIGKTVVAALVRQGGGFVIKLLDTKTGAVARILDDMPCRDKDYPGALRMSADDLVVSYTCAGEPTFGIWSLSQDRAALAAQRRIETLRGRSYDIYFGKRQTEFMLISEPGLAMIASLNDDGPVRKFIIATLGTVAPKDVAFSSRSWHFAVLDLQDVLTIYEPTRLFPLRKWLSSKSIANLEIAFQTSVGRGGKASPSRSIAFTPGERCVEVERVDGKTDSFFVDKKSLLYVAQQTLDGKLPAGDLCTQTDPRHMGRS